MEEVLRQRMYFLVMYNISEIQKGIQAGHAQNEYELLFGDSVEYKQWSRYDKTWMVMNGGTSNIDGRNKYNTEICVGSMETNLWTLQQAGVSCAPFYEPDLNNSNSAIAFLADERIWDKELYPDPTNDVLLHEGEKSLRDVELLEIAERKTEYFTKLFNDGRAAWLRIFCSNLKFA